MSTVLFWCLAQLSSFSGIVPLLFSAFNRARLSPVQKRLSSLIVLIFVTELIVNIIWLNSKNNNPIFHFYVIVEFFFMLRIFKLVMSVAYSNYWFYGLFFVFSSFAIVNTIYFQPLHTFNSNATTLSAFLVLILTLFYFYTVLQKGEYKQLNKMPMFWIGAGMLIYFATNLLLFFISKNEIFAQQNGSTIWGVHAVVNIVLMTFYTLALWIQPKTD